MAEECRIDVSILTNPDNDLALQARHTTSRACVCSLLMMYMMRANKLKTVLTRDRLACLAPPDIMYMYINADFECNVPCMLCMPCLCSQVIIWV